MKRFASLLAAFVLAGCASMPSGDSVALPSTTPFDADPMARAAYLQGFSEGYHAVGSGRLGSVDVIQGPHKLAREMGWRAGVVTAQGDAAEHQAK